MQQYSTMDKTFISILLLSLGLLTIVETAPSTECPKTDFGGSTLLLAHPSDCTKYYMCSGGRKYVMQCPPMGQGGDSLHFNFEKQICDRPSDVSGALNARNILRWEISDEHCDQILPVPTRCPSKLPDDYPVHIAHETKCNKFYKCSPESGPVELSCPGILVFNRECQVCDFPSNVDCEHLYPGPGESTTTSTTATSTTAATATSRPTTADTATSKPTTGIPTTTNQ